MHECLLIDELLSIIFENFLYDENPSGSTLAALARTCHRFSEPALNLLWREIGVLSILIQCMPGDLWELRGESHNGGRSIEFVRPLVETDWHRFQHLAEKVHVFGKCRLHNDAETIRISDTIWSALTTYRSIKCLLPNLRSLYLTSDPPYPTQFLEAFLGPSIHSINITHHNANEGAFDLIYLSILRLCPNLKKVSTNSVNFGTSFKELIHSLPTLTHIDAPYIYFTVETLEQLSQYSALEQLTCGDALFPKEIRLSGHFPSLKKLECCVNDWPFATGLINQIHSHLTELSIDSDSNKDTKAFPILNFMCTLGSHPSASSLTMLKLSCASEFNDLATSPGIFEPLFGCTGLQYLHLSSQAVTTLDDIWLSKASSAWPQLQCMDLDGLHTLSSRMTLAGLVPLVKNCPFLQELSVSLYASPINPPILDGVCNTNLTYVVFGMSAIESPPEVVHSLVRLFPSLSQIICSYNNDQRGDWEAVNRMLNSMKL